jgi:CRP-like cAMP-binding protein
MSSGFVKLAEKLANAIGVVEVEPMYLANMFSAGSLAEVPVGHNLCDFGGPSDKVFLLVDGVVAVSKPDITGVLRPIAEVHAPAMIGHMGIIDGSLRSASCKIGGTSPAMLISLSADAFRRLLARPDPTGAAVRHLVLANLIRQLGNTNITVAALLDGVPEQEAATQASESPNHDITEADLHLLQAVLRGWSVPPEG